MMRNLLFLLSLGSSTLLAFGTSQMQVTEAQVMTVINPGASIGPDSGTVGTDPNLSYEMMSNQSGVGKELYLLQAKEAGDINNQVTTGGMLQTDVTSNASTDNTNP